MLYWGQAGEYEASPKEATAPRVCTPYVAHALEKLALLPAFASFASVGAHLNCTPYVAHALEK